MIATIGQSASELLEAIVNRNPSINSLELAIYRPTDGFVARVALSNPSLAVRLRSEFPEVRWDPTLSILDQKILIRERLFHDAKDEFERRTSVPAEGFGMAVQEIVKSLTSEQTVAICSGCNMRDGTRLHIPMMDFSCKVHPDNLKLIQILIQFMGLRGAILDSGNSYHFYGFDLIDENAWLNLMSKFLLSSPLADFRYIAHRLLGRTCVLRLTPNAIKPTTPTVKMIV
jgi:hypothetical protein